jgi:hypothetical protein
MVFQTERAIMKRLVKLALTSVLILLGIVLSEAALAQRGGGGSGHGGGGFSHGGGGWGHGGGGHFGGARFGFYFGVPLYGLGYYPYYYPPYSYPPAYYPPAAYMPSSPPIYVEEDGAQPAPAQPSQQNWWYYCVDSKTYYPYVKECPGGWQRVAPQPPSG